MEKLKLLKMLRSFKNQIENAFDIELKNFEIGVRNSDNLTSFYYTNIKIMMM